MRTTIDKAGRLVIPKALREQAGIAAGEVDVSVEGSSIRIDAVAVDDLVEEDGILMLPAGGEGLDDAAVREMRFADQR